MILDHERINHRASGSKEDSDLCRSSIRTCGVGIVSKVISHQNIRASIANTASFEKNIRHQMAGHACRETKIGKQA